MNKIIIAGNVSSEAVSKLKELNIEIIKTYKCMDVYDEISYHPDIQMFVGNNEIVVSPNMYDMYNKILIKNNILIEGISILKNKYPDNIMYNGCLIGKYFIHNLKYTDKRILELLGQKNIELVNINQGYSKCSISIIDDNNVITSDRGIEKAISKFLNVLYIEPDENIKLGNMNGFIGGATGIIDENWCINGDINRLKECNKIIDFLNLNHKNIICLTNKEIIDIGSIIQIKY